MANLTLSREMQNMAERLAENSHDIWAKKKKEEMASSGNNLFSHTPTNTCKTN
jgi:ryanodine receptor 2